MRIATYLPEGGNQQQPAYNERQPSGRSDRPYPTQLIELTVFDIGEQVQGTAEKKNSYEKKPGRKQGKAVRVMLKTDRY